MNQIKFIFGESLTGKTSKLLEFARKNSPCLYLAPNKKKANLAEKRAEEDKEIFAAVKFLSTRGGTKLLRGYDANIVIDDLLEHLNPEEVLNFAYWTSCKPRNGKVLVAVGLRTYKWKIEAEVLEREEKQ